jgi:beta-glucosidase
MDCWTNFVKYGNPNGRSSESRQARLDGRVVTDEGKANQPGSESWAPFTLGNPYVKTLNVKPAQGYQSRLLSHEAEIDNIINGMTLEEKIDMLHGKNMFSSAGIPRLGITDVEYADGPFGIREEMEPHSWNSAHLTTDSATFFPTGSALAATWSTEWAYAYGRGMSREARLRGKDMILGPAINIQRIPTGGRTYEYLSEDPILSGMLAVAYTKGSQDDGTAVCLKHYALNNQEDYRGFVDVRISDRAMHEIYLRPFEMAVREADAWGVMAAYNKVNGRWCSENETLLTTILRQQWGFPGMVISDWGGVHSTVDAVTAGMNVEMPGSRFMGQALLDSVKAGKVSEAVINQRVREILRVRLTVRPIAKDVANTKPVGNAEEMTTALEVARRSIVLLKNEKVLPIDTKKVKRIAVIGENAVTKMALGGVGAGVKTRCEITPLEGLKSILGNQVEITYVPGYKSYDRDSRNKHLNPIQPADRELMAQAVETAKNADLVIFFAGDNREVETEGSDRKSVTLPSGQDELAVALAKANKRLVTVIVSGGPVDVSTMSEVSGALVASWFNGSMGGQALAEVLTGKISPSGKLPMTWPKRLEDVPAYATGTYPQTIENNSQGDIFVDLTRNRSNERRQQLIADYAEQDLVGYRWYEQKHVAPAYPFGYGLSYATFEYSNLNVKHTADGFDVSFTLTNTSDRDAEEVAQVYISRLIKELKGFRRVALKAGERKVITIPIRRSDLCHWDEATQAWRLEPDDITILVGGSSDNLPLTSKNEIK